MGEGRTAASWKCGDALGSDGVLFLWFYFVAWISINPKEQGINTSHIFSRQYQDFLEDLEEDEAIRKNVNIYRSKAFLTSSGGVIKSCLNLLWGKTILLKFSICILQTLHAWRNAVKYFTDVFHLMGFVSLP